MDADALFGPIAACNDSCMTTDFWDRLVEAFGDMGLDTSQSAIARELQIAQSAVAKWKLGTGYPHLKKCLKIAEMTGVDANWLLTGRGSKKGVGGEVDEITQTLLDQWADLPAAKKREALEYVRFLAHQARSAEPEPAEPSPGKS